MNELEFSSEKKKNGTLIVLHREDNTEYKLISKTSPFSYVLKQVSRDPYQTLRPSDRRPGVTRLLVDPLESFSCVVWCETQDFAPPPTGVRRLSHKDQTTILGRLRLPYCYETLYSQKI